MKQKVQDLIQLLTALIPEGLPENTSSQSRRRLEIIIRTHLGQSQAEICREVGCSKETARYWMTVAKTEAVNSWSDNSVGRPKVVNDLYLKRLQELVCSSPQEYGYGFKNWTARWLSQHLAKELGISISDRHVNRLLKQMGLSTRGKNRQITQKSELSAQNSKIVIRDLNPSLLSQSEQLLWKIYQNK